MIVSPKRRLLDGQRGAKPLRKGFALVISLVLMAFLVLLLLSMSILLQVETALSTQVINQEKARENAHIALMVALGELQEASGPDQRVTGRADILYDNNLGAPGNRYWTGVWDNRLGTDPDSPPDNILNYGANRDSSGRIDRAPRWLISSSGALGGNAPTQTIEALNDPSAGGLGVVPLVGETAPGADDGIRAGLLPVRLSGDVTAGRIAWWVGDEGVKAKVNMTDRTQAYHVGNLSKQWSLLSPQKTNFSHWLEGDGGTVNPDDEIIDRALTLSQFASIPGVSGEDNWSRKHFHDITTHSYGVLSDARLGGLKIDLSRGLEEQWPEFLRLHDKDYAGSGWPNMASVFRVRQGSSPLDGPYWDVLYSFYHLHKPFQPFAPALRTQRRGFTEVSYQGYQDGRYQGENFLYNIASDSANRAGDQRGGPLGMADRSANHNPTVNNFPPSMMARAGAPAGDGYSRVNRAGSPGAFRSVSTSVNEANFFGKRRDFDLNYVSSEGSTDTAHRAIVRQDPVYNILAPVLLRAGIKLSLVIEEEIIPGDPPETGYRFKLLFHPFAVLWNPYNVELEAYPYEVDLDPGLAIQIFVDGERVLEDGGGNDLALTRLIETNARPESRRTTFSHVTPVNPLSFATEYAGFRPGEIKIYGMPHDAIDDAYSLHHSDARLMEFDGQSVVMSNEFTEERGVYVYIDEVPRHNVTPRRSESGWAGEAVPAVEDGELSIRISSGRFMHFDLQLAQPLEDQGGVASSGGRPFSKGLGALVEFTQFLDGGSLDIPDLEGLNLSDFIQPGEATSTPIFLATIEARLKETGANGVPLFSQLNPRKTHGQNVTRLSNSDTWEPTTSEISVEVTDGTLQIALGSGGGSTLAPSLTSYGPSGVTHAVLYDVPRQPIHSVGDFMHANISWLDINPNYAVGGGYLSPLTTPTAPYRFNQPLYYTQTNNASANFPDYSYLLNTALFDRYFFSTVPIDWGTAPAQYADYSAAVRANLPPLQEGPYDADYLRDGKPFPNSRMVPVKQKDLDYDSLFAQLNDLQTAAAHLLVDGAFNVNSTSEEAWFAFLGGLRAGAGFSYDIYNAGSNASDVLNQSDLGGNPIPRFSAPMGHDNDAWTGFRNLTDSELRSLASEMVNQVKERGPFLSMADFVNRRLVNNNHGRRGALQAAIDNTNINSGIGGSTGYPLQTNPGGAVNLGLPANAGIPGYLLQNDILRNFSQVMTVRSDTFIIRAYGDVVNPITNDVTARAWCEAVVQRIPDYVNPANSAEEQVYQDAVAQSGDWRAPSWVAALNEENLRFGRRYVISSFRWLDHAEVQALASTTNP